MHVDPHERSRRPPGAHRALVRLLRQARHAPTPPMDPHLPDRVLARLGLLPPGAGPAAPVRVPTRAPRARARQQVALVALLALLALLLLPPGARRDARLAQAPGLGTRPAPAAPPAHPPRAPREAR